jgi:hypothetical protein
MKPQKEDDMNKNDGAASLVRSDALLAEALDILRLMTDPDPCDYDYHDLCQTHNLHDRPCPHERAKVLFNRIAANATAHVRDRIRLVRRVSDGKVLPVVDEQGDEICVKELFPFGDGGPSPRPLRLWHKRSQYVLANA